MDKPDLGKTKAISGPKSGPRFLRPAAIPADKRKDLPEDQLPAGPFYRCFRMLSDRCMHFKASAGGTVRGLYPRTDRPCFARDLKNPEKLTAFQGFCYARRAPRRTARQASRH